MGAGLGVHSKNLETSSKIYFILESSLLDLCYFRIYPSAITSKSKQAKQSTEKANAMDSGLDSKKLDLEPATLDSKDISESTLRYC